MDRLLAVALAGDDDLICLNGFRRLRLQDGDWQEGERHRRVSRQRHRTGGLSRPAPSPRWYPRMMRDRGGPGNPAAHLTPLLARQAPGRLLVQARAWVGAFGG